MTQQDFSLVTKNKSLTTLILPSILFLLAIGYTISPIDIIPDVPIVGWIDDIIVLLASGINLLRKIVRIKDSIRKIFFWFTIVIATGVLAYIIKSFIIK